MKINYDRLPEHMRTVARMYVERGFEPGGFLLAVLANDLKEAFVRADDVNRDRMFDWVAWLRNDVPRRCHGSRDAVSIWMAHDGMEGASDE